MPLLFELQATNTNSRDGYCSSLSIELDKFIPLALEVGVMQAVGKRNNSNFQSAKKVGVVRYTVQQLARIFVMVLLRHNAPCLAVQVISRP